MRPTRSILAVALLVASLTGCNTGSTNSDDYVIGAVLALTGDFSRTDAPALVAMQEFVGRVNEAGGINGKRVRLETRDDQSDSARTTLAAEDLIDNASPDVLITVRSSPSLAVAPITNARKVLHFTLSNTPTLIVPDTHPYTFCVFPTIAQQFAAVVTAGTIVGGSDAKYGILHPTESAGVAANEEQQRLLEANDLEYVGSESYVPGATDFTVQLSSLRAAGATVVLHTSFPGDTTYVMRAVRDLAWDGVFVVSNTGGITEPVPDIPEDIQERFRALGVGLTARAADDQLPPYAVAIQKYGTVTQMGVPVATHDSLEVWKWAVERAGTTNPMP